MGTCRVSVSADFFDIHIVFFGMGSQPADSTLAILKAGWEGGFLGEAIIDGNADVVYGSRFIGGDERRILFFWHTIANKLLTLLSNMFTNLNLTDMETCYKVFKKEIIKKIDLKEKGFGFDPEVTAKIAKLKPKIYEIGISYFGRTYEQGKKIGLKDAFIVLKCIILYNLF